MAGVPPAFAQLSTRHDWYVFSAKGAHSYLQAGAMPQGTDVYKKRSSESVIH